MICRFTLVRSLSHVVHAFDSWLDQWVVSSAGCLKTIFKKPNIIVSSQK